MDELDYATHLDHYTWMFAGGRTKEMHGYAQTQAQIQHSSIVSDALVACYVRLTLHVSPTLKNAEARNYLLHGAGRRLNMMVHSYREIIHIADPSRTKPLSDEEQQTLGRDINLLYVNLRGLLDNLATTLLHEKQPSLADLKPTAIGLFSPQFRSQFAGFAVIAADVQLHDAWNKDVKERRDPVAHRIPLYLPHTATTPDEAARYGELNEQFVRHANELNFEESGRAFERMHRIGTYLPYFLHHPSKPPIPLYPTIPTDLAHVIRLAAIVERALAYRPQSLS